MNKTIGYIFCERKLGKDEKVFMKIARKKGVKLVMFNLAKKIGEKEIKRKAKKCDIIFNNSGEEIALEFIKTLERFGKKVVDSSRVHYYVEDKWLFFLLCEKNRIPCPKTILLSEDIRSAEEELNKFNRWPVVLKRVFGTMGEYVERARNIEEAKRIIEKFWEKGKERIPIIAQEFIKSYSYRVTIINKEIVQTVIKQSKGWKCTGVYGKKFKKFEITKTLKKILDKLLKVVDIKVCGVDLLKKGRKWLVLEVNTVPALDFFEEEREFLVEKIFDFLINEK